MNWFSWKTSLYSKITYEFGLIWRIKYFSLLITSTVSNWNEYIWSMLLISTFCAVSSLRSHSSHWLSRKYDCKLIHPSRFSWEWSEVNMRFQFHKWFHEEEFQLRALLRWSNTDWVRRKEYENSINSFEMFDWIQMVSTAMKPDIVSIWVRGVLLSWARISLKWHIERSMSMQTLCTPVSVCEFVCACIRKI